MTAFNATMPEWADEMMTPSDHSWVLARSIGIMGMQGGFALLEAGCVRALNRANIMMKVCDALALKEQQHTATATSHTLSSLAEYRRHVILHGALHGLRLLAQLRAVQLLRRRR